MSQLRVELDTALEGSRRTGQLNPRHRGPVNGLIQFFKKVMRRSLTWYTRPLHLFQAAVIRSLQQIIAILSNYRDQIQGIAERTNLQADALEQTKASFAASLTNSLTASTREVSARMHSLSDRLDAQLNQLKTTVESAQAQQIANQAQQLAAQAQQVETLKAELQAEVQAQRSDLQSLSAQLKQATSQQRIRERDMRRLVHAVEQSGLQAVAPAPPGPVPPMFPVQIKSEVDFDYFAFEDRYRGDETDIRERQQSYLEYFRGRENVVDIGCGRGEFLEILRDNGISARGVELGTDQYLLCKEKGLDVVQEDLFSFLESTPDESLGGIFSAQVIEHMTAGDQLRYVALAYQKTKPGSPVIFETINPECVYALLRNFFLDPTHVRPIHPETLQFAMECAKFRNVELRFSGAATYKQIPPLVLEGNHAHLQEFNAGIQQLNQFLYGYQDYAAIGWK